MGTRLSTHHTPELGMTTMAGLTGTSVTTMTTHRDTTRTGTAAASSITHRATETAGVAPREETRRGVFLYIAGLLALLSMNFLILYFLYRDFQNLPFVLTTTVAPTTKLKFTVAEMTTRSTPLDEVSKSTPARASESTTLTTSSTTRTSTSTIPRTGRPSACLNLIPIGLEDCNPSNWDRALFDHSLKGCRKQQTTSYCVSEGRLNSTECAQSCEQGQGYGICTVPAMLGKCEVEHILPENRYYIYNNATKTCVQWDISNGTCLSHAPYQGVYKDRSRCQKDCHATRLTNGPRCSPRTYKRHLCRNYEPPMMTWYQGKCVNPRNLCLAIENTFSSVAECQMKCSAVLLA